MSLVIIGYFREQFCFQVYKTPGSGNAARTRSALCCPLAGAVAGAAPGGFREGRSGAGAMVRAGGPRERPGTRTGTPWAHRDPRHGHRSRAPPRRAGGERAGGRSPAEARPPGGEGRAVTAGTPFIICINFIVIPLIYFLNYYLTLLS